MFDVLDIGASGLQAQRTRLETISANMANATSTHNAKGEAVPYRRRFVLFAPGQAGDATKAGVHVEQVKLDQSPYQKRWDPGHPDAVKDGADKGYVMYPNVDTTVEYVNALEASRAYEANVTMIEVSKQMLNSALRLIA